MNQMKDMRFQTGGGIRHLRSPGGWGGGGGCMIMRVPALHIQFACQCCLSVLGVI